MRKRIFFGFFFFRFLSIPRTHHHHPISMSQFTAASEATAQQQREQILQENKRAADVQKKQARSRQKQEAEDLEDEFAQSSEEKKAADNNAPATMTMDEVISAHQPQLKSMNLPPSLWAPLVTKLVNQTMDAGTTFGYVYEEEQPYHLRWDVCSVKECRKEENVWIVPHIWSFPDEPFAVETLSRDYTTAARIATLMGREDLLSEMKENDAPGSEITEKLMSELQRYAYPLFDSDGQRYYYVMDEFGSRVRMKTDTTTTTTTATTTATASSSINTTFGVVQSLLDGYTYTVFWLHENVENGACLRRAPQHRLSLLGRGKDAWETRFEYETVYDWYGGWDDGNGELRNIVFKHVPNKKDSKCLIVGTGTSTFPVRMCESGYQHVHGTDYVEAVIQKMAKQTQDMPVPRPTWEVMDATKLSSKNESYDVVLDKGCLDAMLIPEGSTGKTSSGGAWIDNLDDSSMAMTELSEVARVLKKGGILLLFSFHPQPGFIDALANGLLELTKCYEITNMNPKTRVPTTKTFVDMFRVYVFTKQ